MNKWVLCLKHGTKYNSDDVNKLYHMVKRNMSVPFNFLCLTDDFTGLEPGIKTIKLPNYPITGWWFKVWVLNNVDLCISGTILFIDLDMVIINNIDKLWDYEPESFCIIRDFLRFSNPNCRGYNSSVFKFKPGRFNYVWDDLYKDLTQINNFHGDQNWFEYTIKDAKFFPDEWIQSYKWEIRDRHDLIRDSITGKLKFNSIKDPIINSETMILAFHGNPKLHEIHDPIIINNWK
jgi:hypothetical protein